MRPTSVILASIVALVLGADPAGAHVCAQPVEVDVGEPASLTVGIGAETTAVTGVEVGLPDGFELTDASADGWDIETGDSAVGFSGGSVAPFACGFVTLRGRATEQGTLVFPLRIETVDGRTVVYDTTDPFREDSALLVYAGVEMPSGLGGADDGGRSPLEIAGWALLGVGAVLAVALVVGAWRQRAHAGPNDDR